MRKDRKEYKPYPLTYNILTLNTGNVTPAITPSIS